ncbi:MAG TPA: hypothetical protein VK634_19650, partial [Reyranella sp.]|nr:hypothetical protein [Reyranella sp.]
GRVDDAHAAAAQSVRARAERRAAKSTPSGTVQDAVRNGSGSVQDGVTIDSQSVQDGPQPNDYNEIPEAPASSRARANHQPPTTNQKKEITKTSFCGEVSREATPLNPPPPRPSNASVLPEGWEPKPDLASWAETKLADEAPGLSVGGEVERFRNHYRGKAGRTTSNDWSATFKNWIGDSISRSKTNGQRPHHDYQKPSGKLGAGAERYILAEYARSGGPESADEQRRSAKPIVVGSASLADDAPATEKRNRKAR